MGRPGLAPGIYFRLLLVGYFEGLDSKMKDGRTHLAHKAEHAVDLDTGAIVAVTIQGADEGDTHTLPETLAEAASSSITSPTPKASRSLWPTKSSPTKAATVARCCSSSPRTFSGPTSVSQTAVSNRGAIKRTRATRSMGIVAASEVTAASGY